MGRLWQVSSASGTTRFVHDGDALIGEYDMLGNILHRYVHGADAGADDRSPGTTRWRAARAAT